jgi:D-alanyl-lipoteichoic acid acyltransferase DltB (MBOAT superfamily)
MEITSITFLIPVILLGTLHPLLRALAWRQAALAGLNLVCAAILLRTWPAAAALLAFLASGYAMALLLRRRPRRAYLAGYLLLLVGTFAYLKNYSFLELLLPSGLLGRGLVWVGISYMLFRQIHFLVDQYQGNDDPLDPWTYLHYQISIFSLVSGPITRYQDFHEDWHRLEPTWASRAELLTAYARIWIGVIKVLALGALCNHLYILAEPLWTAGSSLTELQRWSRAACMFYAYPLYIYFNFSGYCDIVIGLGRLYGLRVPENFHKPFLSRNMIEFWTRWHITLGAWIKDYLYTPALRATLTWFPRTGANLAFACYFLAFFVAGVWHGSSWNFVLYGLLQGLGVSAAKLWEMFLTRWLGREGHQAYLASRPLRWAATGFNFHYFCLTCVVFGLNVPALRQLAATLTARP